MRDVSWLKNGYFAHRGLHDKTHPENSLSSFKNAIDHGYDIELDLRITKDNEIVIVHDRNLKRLCNLDKNVEELTLSEIKSKNLLNSKEYIPTLKETLDSIPDNVFLMIEFKTSSKNKEIVREFKKIIKNYNHTYCVLSFNPFLVYRLRKELPNIIRGQVAKKFPSKMLLFGFMMTHLMFNIITKPDFIIYKFENLPKRQLDRLSSKYLIMSYTVKTQEQMDYIKSRYHNAVFENFLPKKDI